MDVTAAVTVKVKFKYTGDTLELESQAFTKGKTDTFTYTLVKAGSGSYTAEPEDPAVISVAINNDTGEATVQCLDLGSSRIKVKDVLSGEEKFSGVITVPKGAVLTLSPGKNDIKVKAKTADGSAVTVTGCTVDSLASGTETALNAKDSVIILEGNITELELNDNQLTALNVQGCAALQSLICTGNQLSSLNVQGCNGLKMLACHYNQLTELNVEGCTALKMLACFHNQLTELNAQGFSALKELDCSGNQLNAEAMTKILNALPEREAGKNGECYLYIDSAGESNHNYIGSPEALKTAFDAAKARHWAIYKWKLDGAKEGVF